MTCPPYVSIPKMKAPEPVPPPPVRVHTVADDIERLERQWHRACALFLRACFNVAELKHIRVLAADVMAARARLDRALGEP